MSRRRWLVRGVLAAVLAASGARLALMALRFGRESVQADFSAFYTAGQAARAGRSPYWNAPDHEPPLWDGVSLYETSRFLYPPLAASLFASLSRLDYATAKHLWLVVTVAAVAVALAALVRALRWRPAVETWLGLAAFTCLFQPLVLHLERGQVDALTLLAVALALRPMVAKGSDTVGSGVLLAVGAVLKPNVAGLLPFLVLRRRWRSLAGFAATAVAAVIATVVLHGVDGAMDYATRELPRISVEGEAHGDERRLDPSVLARLRQGAPAGLTPRDGRLYHIESFRFVTNASLTRPLKRRLGLRLGPGRLGLLVLAALVAVAGLAGSRSRARTPAAGGLAELAFWQAAMAAVLLAWPVTWAMNTVWLLPAALVIACAWPQPQALPARAALVICGAGLLLAAVPDRVADVTMGPLASLRYVIAEILVFACLLVAWRGFDRTSA